MSSDIDVSSVGQRAQTEVPLAEAVEANTTVQSAGYKTEFHQIVYEFTSDIEIFRDKYPLISAISVVAFAVFGLMNLLSFSIANIITGAFLLTLTGAMIVSILKKPLLFITEVGSKISQVKAAIAMQKAANTSAEV